MNKEKNQVALISVFAAIFLTGFKLTIGTMTNSLGILSEALHSGLDLVAAIITLFAVRVSTKDADKDHHYGHGKIENFSALIETLLLFITCFWICYEAIHRLITGNIDIKVTIFSYIVVITSIVVDVWRSRKLMRAAKKYNSQALEADALHFSTDIWSSAVVLLGLISVTIGQMTGIKLFNYADSVAALFVALIVIHVCWKLGKRAVDALLDRAPDCVDDIETVVKRFTNILSYHSFKVRQSGHQYYVDVCVHVDDKYSLTEAYSISEDLEKEINLKNMKRFTSVIVFLAFAIASYAQLAPDYLISFGASGDTNVIGTIQVVNISDPDTVYLNGGDVLHLIGWGVGIQNPEKQSDMQIYPNPMTDKSTLKFIGSGNTNISIIDMCGKSLYKIDKSLQYGLHTFTINGVKQGMYLVRVSGKNFNYSTKLLSNSFFENDINISYTSFEPQTGGSHLKNSQTTVEMTYDNGELLQYKGTTGTYTNFIMDRPNKSKTITFNFLRCLDLNGHNYSTVQIAVNSKKSPMDTTMQIWMAENLNVGVYRTSGQGFHQDTIVEKLCYGNNQDNCNIYGGLYSWDEAMAYDTTEGSQGICPDGWHIPTDDEWNELVVSFGGSWQVINPWLKIDTIAGGYMKETSFNHWTDPNTGATNSSGFTALPGGMWVKDYGSYYCNINTNANFYTSKRYFNSQNWVGYMMSFEYLSTWIWRGMTDNRDALSIRCIHD